MYWISSFQRDMFLFQVTLMMILKYLVKKYHVAFQKDDEIFNINGTTTCAFNSKIHLCFMNCKLAKEKDIVKILWIKTTTL